VDKIASLNSPVLKSSLSDGATRFGRPADFSGNPSFCDSALSMSPKTVFAKHFFASGFGQLAHLCVDAWAVRRYPRIAVFHALLMAAIYAKEKPFRIKA